MEYTEDIILRVNELYHDLEGGDYHLKHEDIFEGDKDYWNNFINDYIKKINVKESERVILDIGTGSGFVPLSLGIHLGKNDTVYCTDISQKILDAAKINIEKNKFETNFRYLKVDGKTIGVPDGSIDLVTINSVLHHIPIFETFFKELDRILKSGGRIVIGHEPNKSFFLNKHLWKNFVVLFLISKPQTAAYLVLNRLGLVPFIKSLIGRHSQEIAKQDSYELMVNKINDSLMEEGLIAKRLSIEDISKIIDFHSPTAGQKANEFNGDKGIDIKTIVKELIPHFQIDYYETYNHLFRLSHKNWFTKMYSSLLKKIYPSDGAAFFVVLEKN